MRRKQAEYILNEITRLRAQGGRDGKVRDLTPEEALKLLVMFRNKKKGKKKAKRAVAVDADGWEEAGGAGEMEEEKKDEEDAEEEEGGEEDEEEDSCGCGGEGKVLVSPCSCIICTDCCDLNESEKEKDCCIMCGDPAHTWARLDDVEALSEFAEGRDSSKLAATKRKRSEHLNELGALNWSLTAEPCFVPPKIRDLLGRIGSMLDADPKHKCVVFSFFTTNLNIIGYCLKAAGLKFCRYDGKLSRRERQEQIDRWKKSNATGGPPILLVQSECGGTGLTLTEGSYVFMMDPRWNKASEEQAFDRCYRLGQTRDVVVVRCVAHQPPPFSSLRLSSLSHLPPPFLKTATR